MNDDLSPTTSTDLTAETGVRAGLHPVNVTHLVMGVAFAMMAVLWALYANGTVDTDSFRWLLPIPWLAAGAAGLLATVLPSRR